MKNLLVLFLLAAFVVSCIQKEEPKNVAYSFDLYGTSHIVLLNKSTDSVVVEVINYPVIIGGVEDFETTLSNGDSVDYELKTPGYSYFTFTVNEVYHKVFAAPNATIIAEIQSDSTVNFTGDFDSINIYLEKTAGSYYSTNLMNAELVNLTRNPTLNYAEMMRKNDEIVIKHRKIIARHKAELPLWYLELENKRMMVHGAYLKLNSLSYRKRMLDLDDEIPAHYVDSVVIGLPFQDERLMGFWPFERFMFDYSAHSFNPLNDTSANSLKKRNNESVFSYIPKLLPVPFSDYALMSHLSLVLQYNRSKVKTEWIELVSDTTFKNYLYSEINTEEKLPKGASIPPFSGLTVDSVLVNSTQFKDSVLLINFWATFCAPCIANFPHENELAIQYQNQPVKIINMCIESDFEMFKVFVEIHDLQTFNLFADKEITSLLKKQFDIYVIPHSILIDKNGLVVKNKCSVRGEDIVDEIDSLLHL